MNIAALCKELIPNITEAQAEKFSIYGEMLIDWNSRMNLTAITDPVEVVQKHFADSVLPSELIPKGAKVIDVGTGAGFPGVPLAIMREDISLTLLDSLNKRITFLTELCKALDIPTKCIHARAEDGGRNVELRGKYDIATSRAVAGVSPLLEYTVPFLKVGGSSLMYKGPQAEEELNGAANAMKLLGCKGKIVSYSPAWGERNVIIATKLSPTSKTYPRKAGTASKNPL